MNVTLHAPLTDFALPIAYWLLTLRLGVNYGWKPSGTLVPPQNGRPGGLPWQGCYCRPLGQFVVAEDAAALADAIERAAPDMPDVDIPFTGQSFTVQTAPIFHIFSGHNKQVIGQFARFCREGGFIIT